MPKFIAKLHVEPDMEGAGLPGEPDMDDKGMPKARDKGMTAMKKPGQFTLPKSPAKKPPPKKGKM